MAAELCTMCWGEHEYDGPCKPAPKPPKPVAKSRTFDAQFPGRCEVCETGIEVGAEVCFTEDDEVVHSACATRR